MSLAVTEKRLSLVGAILPAVAAVAGVTLLQRLANAPARTDGDDRIVEYPLPFRLLLASLPVGVLGLLIPLLRTPTATTVAFALFWILLLVFLVPCALSAILFQIRFGPNCVEVRFLWRGRRRIPRTAIGEPRAGFVGWNVETKGFGSFRFNPGQRGYRDLLAALRRN